MKQHLDIRIDAFILPLGKMAPRFGNGHSYKHPKQQKWEQEFTWQIEDHVPRRAIECSVRLDLLTVFPRPKYMLRLDRQRRPKFPRGLVWLPKKPDRDNLEKSIQDVMTKVGFWEDDDQVVYGTTLKAYAEVGGSPRIVLRLRTSFPTPYVVAEELGLL